jgi:SpoVK/Ycf46/Vps4 family AAA+-type ATPase
LDHLRGMDAIEEQLLDLAEAVRTSTRSPRRHPRRPTSILLSGPPGGAMTVFTHELARTFRAKLVQVCSSAALPSTNGGSQPVVAAVVNQARYHLPSILVIDEFEAVASTAICDADRHRAANDLLGEALRPIYGASHLVVAVFTAYDDDEVAPAIRNRFEHVVPLDAPRLERALRIYALRTADPELYRAISGARLADHPDLSPPTWGSAA